MYVSLRDRPGRRARRPARGRPAGRHHRRPAGRREPAHRRLLGDGQRGPAALPDRRRSGWACSPTASSTASTRASARSSGSPAGTSATGGDHPKWVAVVGYGVSALSRHGDAARRTTFAAITAVVTADRLGKGLRTAPRDALIADASDPAHARPLVRRAPDARHHRRGASARWSRSRCWPAVPGGYDSIFVAVVRVRRGRRRGARAVRAEPAHRGRRARRRGCRAGLLRGDWPARGCAARCIAAGAARRCSPSATASSTCRCSSATTSRRSTSRCCTSAPTSPTWSWPSPFGRLADRIGRAKVFVGGHLALLGAYLAAGGRCRRAGRDRARAAAARHLLRRHRRRAAGAGQPAGAAEAPGQRHRRRADRGGGGPVRLLARRSACSGWASAARRPCCWSRALLVALPRCLALRRPGCCTASDRARGRGATA